MRITGGKARGIPLTTPKGDGTRPATDQMREALFSSIGDRINGAKVADLFAGTGAYGLEAMSRGADSGIFVENSPKVVACLKKNLTAVSKSCETSSSAWRVLAQKIYSIPKGLGPFDIVFMDPPYEMIEERIPDIFREHIAPIIAESGRLYFEMPGHLSLTFAGFSEIRRLGNKRKDKPTIAVFERVN